MRKIARVARVALSDQYRMGARSTLDLEGHIATDQYLDMAEQASAPATPDSGYGRVYAAKGLAWMRNDDGLDVPLGPNWMNVPLEGAYPINGANWTGPIGSSAIYAWNFPDTSTPSLIFNWCLPPGWAQAGTTWRAKCSISTTATAVITMALAFYLQRAGTTLPAALTFSSSTDATPPGVAYRPFDVEWSPSFAAYAEEDAWQIRLRRSTGDASTAQVYLHSLECWMNPT